MRKTLAAALTLLATATGCGGGGGGPSTAASKSPTSQASCHAEHAVRVEDQGFSRTSASGRPVVVSFAALVRNAGAPSVHASTTVKVTFFDSDGKPLAVNGEAENGTTDSFTLGPVAPGARRAVSGTAVFREWPARMKIEPAAYCATGKHVDDVAATATGLSVSGGRLTARLSLNSPYRADVRAFPVFVFRDKRHRIVGGGPFHGNNGQSEILTVAPGTSERRTVTDVERHLPDGADLDSTTVHLQPLPD
ncbi:hypothetical protein [Streptomyces sp. NPDC058045]|uniref:hypothetical protein n=1 Tax=Streptomyces sp. NPDC058045 TaxID=3346311 RepID=UPI0036EC05C7